MYWWSRFGEELKQKPKLHQVTCQQVTISFPGGDANKWVILHCIASVLPLLGVDLLLVGVLDVIEY